MSNQISDDELMEGVTPEDQEAHEKLYRRAEQLAHAGRKSEIGELMKGSPLMEKMAQNLFKKLNGQQEGKDVSKES